MNNTDLNFTFLRDVNCVHDERQYTKAETYYAGSMIFTSIESMGFIKDGLALKGYELINLIVKGNGLYNKTKNLLEEYIKNGSTKGEIYTEDLYKLMETLRVKTTMSIEKFQSVSVMYNEIKFHNPSLDDCEDEDLIQDKIKQILFDRFSHDNWVAPKEEDYNKPTKKLKVEYDYKNIKEYLESYMEEFMEELNNYLSINKDKNIIDNNTMFDSEEVFRELDIDFYLRDSYSEVKRSLIDIDKCSKDCSIPLIIEDIGKKIKEARLNARLRMSEVSRITGLTEGYISRIENCKSAPSIETLFKLCIAYNVDMDNYLTNQKLKALDNENPKDLEELLSCSKVNIGGDKVSASDKEDILKFAKLLVQSKSDENKSAIKNIIDGVIALV